MRHNTIQRGCQLQHPGKGIICFSIHPDEDSYFSQIKTLEIYVTPSNIQKGSLNLNINEYGAELFLAGESILSVERGKLPFILENNQFQSRHSFWININYKKRHVSVGHGEPSGQTKAGEVVLEEKYAEKLKELSDLHVYSNKSSIEITNKCHCCLSQLGPEQPAKLGENFPMLDNLHESSVLHVGSAPAEIQEMYETIKSITLDTTINGKPWSLLGYAIHLSATNEDGLLYKLLQEKRKRKGKDGLAPMEQMYLRIQMKDGKGDSPGGRYVLEIWAPGHGSIPHRHAECYGVIKVLQGALQVYNFSTLSENSQVMRTTNVATVNQGQTVWLSPLQFQTHSIYNTDPFTTITLQCYSFPLNASMHTETFHYLDENDRKIKEFEPKSDISWTDFKENLFKEYNDRRPVMKYLPQMYQPVEQYPMNPIEEEKEERPQLSAPQDQGSPRLQDLSKSTHYQAQVQAKMIQKADGAYVEIKVKNNGNRSLPSSSVVTLVVGRKSYTKQLSELPPNGEETKILKLSQDFIVGQQSSAVLLLHKAENGDYQRIGNIAGV